MKKRVFSQCWCRWVPMFLASAPPLNGVLITKRCRCADGADVSSWRTRSGMRIGAHARAHTPVRAYIGARDRAYARTHPHRHHRHQSNQAYGIIQESLVPMGFCIGTHRHPIAIPKQYQGVGMLTGETLKIGGFWACLD